MQLLRSSLGFHTLSLLLHLEKKETSQLIAHFKKYSHDTGLLQMYITDGRKYSEYTGKLSLHIKYNGVDRGIKWVIKRNSQQLDFKSYLIEATLNPKILAGISDYITAATYDDMEPAINKFDTISQEISPLLGVFNRYIIKRIDYCINFSVDELAPGCTPKQIMTLIRRADVPPHYKEWDEYNNVAHRTKSSPNSFYLMTPFVTINCYDKYAKLQERTRQNEEQGYPPIPQTTLDAAQGIIRFEVQCKYHKMYDLSRKKAPGNCNVNKYEDLLAHYTCTDIISDYFNKVVGKGDWHTLHDAIRIIESQHFNKQKEKRLIDALRLVNYCRSIAKAKNAFKDDELKNFKKTLKDLSSLNINPVTIPKWWGIKHIPNLLYAYSDKSQEETSRKKGEEFMMECVEEYFHK
jgi:hypothetical protein